MSLYGMLFGKNAHSDRLWDILELDKYNVGRYRDISLRDGKIIVLTRNGGGNREEYEEAFESLRSHPNYINDWDCDWDCTYAEISFSIPEKFAAEVAQMTDDKDPGAKFEDAFQNIDQHAEKLAPLLAAMKSALSGDIIHPDGTVTKNNPPN